MQESMARQPDPEKQKQELNSQEIREKTFEYLLKEVGENIDPRDYNNNKTEILTVLLLNYGINENYTPELWKKLAVAIGMTDSNKVVKALQYNCEKIKKYLRAQKITRLHDGFE